MSSSNWIEVGSVRDGDGATILADAWRLMSGDFANPFTVDNVPATN